MSENDDTGLDKETLEAAMQLVKQSGFAVLTQEQLTERLRRATKEIDPLKARLSELEEQYSSANKQLRKYQDKDKSAEQRIADELKAKQDMIDAYQQKLEVQQRQTEAEKQRAKQMFLHSRLSGMLSSSVDPEAATRLALAEISGLSVDDADGQFALSYTGPDKLPGDATEAVQNWYEKRTFLHRPSGEGVPTSGAQAPGSANNKKAWNDLNGDERVYRAFFKE